MTDQHLTIRIAQADDAHTLRRLGELDSNRPLQGDVLIAERGDSALAALALETGAVTADPFTPTAGAVRLLHQRRDQVVSHGRDSAPRRSLLRRLVPQAA